MTGTRPPGWYPAPDRSQMYWTGTEWLPAPPQAERKITIHYGFVVVAVFSFLATAIPCLFWFASAGAAANDPDPEYASTGAGIGTAFAVYHAVGKKS